MSKGKAITDLPGGRPGLVSHETAPQWSFIYRTSLIKEEKYDIGDHVKLPDGREFVYARSIGECVSGQGCEFTYTGLVYGYPIATHAIGEHVVTIANTGSTTVLTHAAAYAEDVLKGGYYVSHDHPGGDDDAQVRGIIGNAYSAINGVLKLYLDGPLHKAVSTDEFTEIFENPYAALRTGTSAALAKAGVPAVQVKATLMYFWVQIKGPCFLAVQASVNTNDVGCGWRADGSLDGYNHLIANDIDGVAEESSQYAGHRLLGNQSGYGPLFMLRG